MKYNVKICCEFEIDEIEARDERDAMHKFNAFIIHNVLLYPSIHQTSWHGLFVEEINEVTKRKYKK